MIHPTIPPTAITRSWTISAGVPSPKDADANIDSGFVVAIFPCEPGKIAGIIQFVCNTGNVFATLYHTVVLKYQHFSACRKMSLLLLTEEDLLPTHIAETSQVGLSVDSMCLWYRTRDCYLFN
jgi:hypothetical protein